MGGKKKGISKDGEEEDITVDNFMKFYRKNCHIMQCVQNSQIKKLYEEYLEEGEPIKKFHMWDEIGW